MPSDLEFAVQFGDFVFQWCYGFLSDSPQVLFIFLLALLTWRLLSQKIVTPGTAPLLIILIIICFLWEYKNNTLVLNLQTHLAAADQKVRQGSMDRTELLKSMKEARSFNWKNEVDEGNPLDGCLHVFLDLGANRGIQIRKLYEAHTFPLAPVLPLYEKFFGKPEERKLQEICSVMFEPNTKHAKHLQELVDSYATCGIRVLLYKAGVGHKNMKSMFGHYNYMFGLEIGHDAGARLMDGTFEDIGESVEIEEIEVIRLSTFINEIVAKRKLPNSAKVTTPSVVIKSDIEGTELKVKIIS